MEPGITITGGVIVLIINGVLLWIREWRKHRTWRENGSDLKTIRDKIDCVDRKIGETKIAIVEMRTMVDEQKLNCTKTVSRFDQAIRDQNQTILAIAKEGRNR